MRLAGLYSPGIPRVYPGTKTGRSVMLGYVPGWLPNVVVRVTLGHVRGYSKKHPGTPRMYPGTKVFVSIILRYVPGYAQGTYPTKHALAVFVQLLHVPGYQNWLFQSCLGMYPGMPRVYPGTKTGCFGHTWVCPRVSLEAIPYCITLGIFLPWYYSCMYPDIAREYPGTNIGCFGHTWVCTCW